MAMILKQRLHKQKQKTEGQYSDYPLPTLYDFLPEHLKTGYPNWLELPRDVMMSILSRLGVIEILEIAQKVCTQWRDICKDPLMWRSIDMCNLGELHEMPYDLEEMCMHAIDRSCGGLVDISIEFFGTDELLTYMAQSYVMANGNVCRSFRFSLLCLGACWNVAN
ncbi:hypothetical protein PTKIN_Ptkin10aG0195200 [Pterospermum kingtungense]